MRRRLGSVAVLCGLSLVGAGCATPTGDTLSGEIPIGVSIEETGPAAVVGLAEKNALDLVAADVNKKGVNGKRIKLVYRDNKSDEKQAGRDVTSLINDDKVVGVVGAATSQ